MLPVTHFAGGFSAIGGVEAMVRWHWKMDAEYGMESSFVAYCEESSPVPRLATVPCGSSSTIKGFRSRLKEVIGGPSICVYHNFWWLPYSTDIDQAERRLLVVHGYIPALKELIPSRERFADGILCVSQPLKTWIAQLLPQINSERIGFLPVPIFPPPDPPPKFEPLGNRPLILGYCGRLIIDSKRVDRIPDFLRALDATGVAYRFELLGDGPDRAFLEEKLQGNSRVLFHGVKRGPEYWEILRKWDCLLLVSDVEGTPISVIEALSQGVIPLMPAIGSGADEYVRALGPGFLFERGDLGAAAALAASLTKWETTDLERLRNKGQELVRAHDGRNYMRVFKEFVERIRELPKRSSDRPRTRPFPLNHLSFSSLEKLGALRNSLQKWAGGSAAPPFGQSRE
jgi:glycosyltransferase involved in cell wall biosynthesis